MDFLQNLPVEHDTDIVALNTAMPLLQQYSSANFQPMKLTQGTKIPAEEFKNPTINNNELLKNILKKQKKNALVKQFIAKMKRTIAPSRMPPNLNLQGSQQCSKLGILHKKLQKTRGIKTSILFNIIWSVLMILQAIFTLFFISILLIFPQLKHDLPIKLIFYLLLLFAFLDILVLTSTQRFQEKCQLSNLKQILVYFLKQDLPVDILAIWALLISIHNQNAAIGLLSLAICLKKIAKSISRVQKFGNLYLSNIIQQKYYNIGKTVLINLIVAHIMATLLVLMVRLSPQHNWMVKLDILDQHWAARYLWGYYWGANTMFTIGFAEITTTNYKQAIIFIIVKAVSYFMLVYNIHAVGSVLSDIKTKQSQNKKQIKALYCMSSENKINNELKKQMMTFIDQSQKIKQKFLSEEQDHILKSLPASVSNQYKRQSNKFLFDDIPFVNLLSKKGTMKLAEVVERKICYAQQTIFKKGDICQFTILHKGTIKYLCRSRGSKIDGKVIDIKSIQKGSKSAILLSLKFFKLKTYNFDVKSQGYSVIYTLSPELFANCMRQFRRDFQIFCEWRDRDQLYLDQKQISQCKFCIGEKHCISECPKMHYVPLKKLAIYKKLQKQKNKNRIRLIQRKPKKCYGLKDLKKVSIEQNSISKNHKYVKQLNQHKKLDVINRTLKSQKQVKNSSQMEQKVENIPKLPGQTITSHENIIEIDKVRQALSITIKQNVQPFSFTGFWPLELDQCHDFSYYMKEGNPKRLLEKLIL